MHKGGKMTSEVKGNVSLSHVGDKASQFQSVSSISSLLERLEIPAPQIDFLPLLQIKPFRMWFRLVTDTLSSGRLALNWCGYWVQSSKPVETVWTGLQMKTLQSWSGLMLSEQVDSCRDDNNNNEESLHVSLWCCVETWKHDAEKLLSHASTELLSRRIQGNEIKIYLIFNGFTGHKSDTISRLFQL